MIFHVLVETAAMKAYAIVSYSSINDSTFFFFLGMRLQKGNENKVFVYNENSIFPLA